MLRFRRAEQIFLFLRVFFYNALMSASTSYRVRRPSATMLWKPGTIVCQMDDTHSECDFVHHAHLKLHAHSMALRNLCKTSIRVSKCFIESEFLRLNVVRCDRDVLIYSNLEQDLLHEQR